MAAVLDGCSRKTSEIHQLKAFEPRARVRGHSSIAASHLLLYAKRPKPLRPAPKYASLVRRDLPRLCWWCSGPVMLSLRLWRLLLWISKESSSFWTRSFCSKYGIFAPLGACRVCPSTIPPTLIIRGHLQQAMTIVSRCDDHT